MLGASHTVTITVSDIDSVEQSYATYLGFQTIDRSPVSQDLAASWGAPAAAGHRQLIMQPESGEESYLRFVEGGAIAEYKPLTTYGWNSTEIIVQDVHAVNDRLLGSPFEIYGTPAALDFEGLDAITAMQVIGPSNEVVYLTEIAAPIPGFDLPEAKSFVGRIFINILSGRSVDDLIGYFAKVFDAPAADIMQGVIRVLNKAQNLPPDQKTMLSSIILPKQTLIEIDEWPSGTTTSRQRRDGHLPPAMAMVTFEHDNLDSVSTSFIAPPKIRDVAPYYGARAATLVGSQGELIELTEQPG